MELDPANLVNILVAVVGALLGVGGVKAVQNRRNNNTNTSIDSNFVTKEEFLQRDNGLKIEIKEQFGNINTSVGQIKIMIAELDGNMKENVGEKLASHVKDYHSARR